MREILSRYFPRTFDFTKGKIFDVHDNVSDSIDIVVLAPNHPLFRNARGDIEIILAEGVFCAIELKPDLTDLPEDFGRSRKQKPEIIRAIEQIRSVKRLDRGSGGVLRLRKKSPEYQAFVKRIPVHLVTATADLPKLASYLSDYYGTHKVGRDEQVDLVLVLGAGVILNAKAPEHGYINTATGAWFGGLIAVDCADDALAWFLRRMSAFPGPEPHMSEPLLLKYLRKLPEGDVIGNWSRNA